MSVSPESVSSDATRIVIIGGGFAGAVTAVKLIDASPGPLALTIVDTADEIGRGVAYGTSDPDHLVNGTAQLFGLFPEDPDHLIRWLKERADRGGWQPPKAYGGGEFSKSTPPRRLYGDYVIDQFRAALARGGGRVTFSHARERAVDVFVEGDQAFVRLESGRTLAADKVVLATGLHPRRSPVAVPDGAEAGAYYVDDIWKEGIAPAIAGRQHVLLLGSSLTMLDALISLEKSGYRGRYTIVSRRGLIVQPRRDVVPQTDALHGDPLPTTALGALRIAQRERRATAARGDDWQSLVPALRGQLAAFWKGIDTRERLRFIRHLRSYWDISLHRASGPSHAFLERARAEGRVERLAARVIGLDIRPGEGVAVRLRRRGSATSETLRVDAVVNSSGHTFDWARLDVPLAQNLLAGGIVRPHATGYGIDADPATLAVIGRDGVPSRHVFAVGHPLRGVSWESSSIGEQLAEAIQLSQALFPPPVAETGDKASDEAVRDEAVQEKTLSGAGAK